MTKNIIKAQFSKYIETIIKNTTINYFKKKKYISSKEVTLEEFEKVSLSVIDEGTFLLLDENIKFDKLENFFTVKEHYLAMKTLTDKQKLVLYLSIIQSMSAKEISIKIGISEITVRTIKSKAIRIFIKNLEKGNK